MMSDSLGGLVIACLRVRDDVEARTFDVNLEDVVRLIDDDRKDYADCKE